MRIVWTDLAIRDLASARDYIAQDSPAAARGQIQHILTAVEVLPRFQQSGRPGRRPGTRELVVGRTPYLVPYRLRGEEIQVLRVLHGRRAWPEAF